LLAYEQLHEDWCLEWYWQVHDWAFTHFPDREHGEWTQRLDRRGNKIDEVIALPVKDPFHLPRALIVAIQTLERLTQSVSDVKPGSRRPDASFCE
jgi:N-acylglucosamine 2-epimerase